VGPVLKLSSSSLVIRSMSISNLSTKISMPDSSSFSSNSAGLITGAVAESSSIRLSSISTTTTSVSTPGNSVKVPSNSCCTGVITGASSTTFCTGLSTIVIEVVSITTLACNSEHLLQLTEHAVCN